MGQHTQTAKLSESSSLSIRFRREIHLTRLESTCLIMVQFSYERTQHQFFIHKRSSLKGFLVQAKSKSLILLENNSISLVSMLTVHLNFSQCDLRHLSTFPC